MSKLVKLVLALSARGMQRTAIARKLGIDVIKVRDILDA